MGTAAAAASVLSQAGVARSPPTASATRSPITIMTASTFQYPTGLSSRA